MLELKPMSEIPVSDWLELLNHPLVRRHMPLATEDFAESSCAHWIAGKERLWETHGFGPHAFLWLGEFVGWGGYQPEGEDADLGLVLHPKHWGLGIPIVKALLEEGFMRFGFSSVIVFQVSSCCYLHHARGSCHSRGWDFSATVRRNGVVYASCVFVSSNQPGRGCNRD